MAQFCLLMQYNPRLIWVRKDLKTSPGPGSYWKQGQLQDQPAQSLTLLALENFQELRQGPLFHCLAVPMTQRFLSLNQSASLLIQFVF